MKDTDDVRVQPLHGTASRRRALPTLARRLAAIHRKLAVYFFLLPRLLPFRFSSRHGCSWGEAVCIDPRNVLVSEDDTRERGDRVACFRLVFLGTIE